MTDRYLSLATTALGRSMFTSLGLPAPVSLERWQDDQPLVKGRVLIGDAGESAVSSTIASVLDQAQADITRDTAGDDTFKAFVFDASGISNSAGLRALYDFFHPVMRRLAACGRVVVLGRTPELCADPKAATAQRALEGFVRAIAKEIKGGSTANLVYVQEGAEAQLASALRFFVSPRSAFVSGQVVRVFATPVSVAAGARQPLAGKTAVVTGAARGIGEAIASVLARDGAHVICVDVPQAADALSEVAARLQGTALPLDITAADAGDQIAAVAKKRKGIDVIVHNAGITRDKTLANMSEAFWDVLINVNLSSIERINDALLAKKAINSNGRIIGVSSISGIAGNFGQSNYATSKAGVVGLVQSMAKALKDQQITVNAVAPGFIETQMTAAIPFTIREAGRRMNSLSQGGLPLDVAEAIAFYADPASAGVTGNVVRVCGQALIGA